MDKKIMAAEVKALDTSNPNGEFLVTLSAPTLDRDGEIVDHGAFEPLPDHISFDIDHAMSVPGTVGSGRPYYDGDRLMVRGTFASTPLGQQVRTLVNEGHIRTASVAMMRPHKEKRDDGMHITKAELLNGAFTPVPANREALIVMSKAVEAGSTAVIVNVDSSHDFTDVADQIRAELLKFARKNGHELPVVIKVGARNSMKDAEHIQSAHDHMVALGATCGDGDDGKTVSVPPDAKGDGGTENTREDTKGAGGDEAAQQEMAGLRAHALQLLADTMT